MNGFRAVALAWTSEISNAGFVSALLVSLGWPAARLENKTAQLRAANAPDIARYSTCLTWKTLEMDILTI
jgi:hypothetical protein